jgi:hypothetical protein
MTLRFGVFDHIEPVPGLRLDRIYRERLLQIERLDTAGFYAYHLAEHHTPAIHSLAPSRPSPNAPGACALVPASTSCRCTTRCV